jgi:hypothetical protein
VQIKFQAAALLVFLTIDQASSDEPVYSNGLPSAAGFFPICVWLQSPVHAAEYKAIGINTFVGSEGTPTEDGLAQLEKNGISLMTDQTDATLQLPDIHVIKGWIQMDEPDNAQPDGKGGYGACIPATQVVQRARDMKAKDSTRPVYVNFGMGVAATGWYGRGPNTGDVAYYDAAVQGSDIVSFDIYPTSINPHEHAEKGRLQYVAEGVARLKNCAKEGQHVWTWLETTPFNNGSPVQPADLHAEAWMALISGASGLGYFVHEFKPKFREDGIFDHPDIVDEVTKLNKTITDLAPVLNSPTIIDQVTVDSTVPISILAKRDAANFYLFTVVLQNTPTAATFTFKSLPQGSAEVLGENRSVEVKNGVLSDSFPGYGVHLYKIPTGTNP